MNQKLRATIETSGITDRHGHKLNGSVAVTYVMYTPVSEICQSDIARGKAFVEKFLSA